MLVYLDNCCYNRPYDDQSQKRIALETKAVISILDKIAKGKIALVSSYVLYAENYKNKDTLRRSAIKNFMDQHSNIYVSDKNRMLIYAQAKQLENYGVHYLDACHVACTVRADSDYFLSTDDRLIKALASKLNMITIMNPVDFVTLLE